MTTILISAKDNYSNTIAKMRTETKGLKGDIEGLSSKMDTLNNTKVDLKIDLSKAKQELRDAKKELDKAKEGTDEFKNAVERFKTAQFKVDNLTSQLSTANAAVKQTQRDMDSMTKTMIGAGNSADGFSSGAAAGMTAISEAAQQAQKDIEGVADSISKADNRADTFDGGSVGGDHGGGDGVGSGAGGLLQSLARAGATRMIGGVIESAVTTYAASMFGDRGGQALETVLGSAVEGAAIGSLAGPIGTVVGAVGGVVLGSITAAVEDYQIKDEYFKGAVQELYQSANTKITDAAQSGTALAASRETSRAAFNTLLGGSEAADEFLSGIQSMANRTPFLYDELTGMSKSLLASGFEAESLMPTLTTLGNAGGVLGMTTSDIDQLAGQLGYMQQSDKVTLQQLKPFVTRGIKAFDYLAEAQGVTTDELLGMISDPNVKLSGKDAVNTILAGMASDFSGGMDLLAGTFSGLSDTVDELRGNVSGAYGESYNSTRMEGLASEREWLERGSPTEESQGDFKNKQLERQFGSEYQGGGGEGLAEWYGAIGNAHAELENTQEAVKRGVADAFMTGDMSGLAEAMGGKLTEADETRLSGLAEQFASAMADYEAGDTEAGFELEALMGIMESEAEALTANTEIATAQHEGQLEMIEGIQRAEEANNKIAERTQEIESALSRGMASIELSQGSILTTEQLISTQVGTLGAAMGNFATNIGALAAAVNRSNRGNAWGLNRVPYDGYKTELHEGERVLTAEQARQQDGANSAYSIVITGNTFNVREDLDIHRVAQSLMTEINLARMVT